LHKWNEALFGGKVLSEESMKSALTPVTLNDGSKAPANYGYGVAINNMRGKTVVAHSGGLHGFVSQLARFTDGKLNVVMLTTQLPPEVMLDPNTIGELYLWQSMDTVDTYDVIDAASLNLKEYEGKYELAPGLMLTVTSEGNSLFAQVTNQGRYEIFPRKKDEFFWKVVEAKVRFNRNNEGKVVSGYFEQGPFKATALKVGN